MKLMIRITKINQKQFLVIIFNYKEMELCSKLCSILCFMSKDNNGLFETILGDWRQNRNYKRNSIQYLINTKFQLT